LDHHPVNPMPMAQHRGGVMGAPVTQSLANRCGRHVPGCKLQDRRDSDAKAHFTAKAFKISGSAGTIRTKAEISADDHMGQTKGIGDDILGKILWRQGGKRMGKGNFVKPFNAKLRQTVGAPFGIHQTERRVIGGEYLTRMRFKCHDPKWRADVIANCAGRVNNRSVPQMHAVKIAYGRSSATVSRINELGVSDNAHEDA
jgi:hypothetical protein